MAEETMPRLSSTKRLELIRQRDSVVELMNAGQPVRQIAATLKITENKVHRLYRDYFDNQVARSALTQQELKHARRTQLTVLDGLAFRYINQAADPSKLAASGMTFRDLQGFIETSRRLKCDLIKLDGLDGPNAATAPSAPASTQTVAGLEGGSEMLPVATIIKRFMDSIADTHPKLYAAWQEEFGDIYGDESESGAGGTEPAEGDASAAGEPANPGHSHPEPSRPNQDSEQVR